MLAHLLSLKKILLFLVHMAKQQLHLWFQQY